MQGIDPQPQQPTPVAEDRHATVQQLHQRAAADYANGWGQPDIRAQASNEDQPGGGN
jgi:hypothetical protein